MSHLTAIELKIRDLEVLKRTAEYDFNALWLENKPEYGWFGRSVGGYPLPDGFTKEMLGKCDHVIHLPGCKYEIGVVKRPDGTYTMLHDFWGPGQKLQERFGVGLKKLTQMYSVNVATKAAQAKGYTVSRVAGKNGAIKLQVTGAGL